MAVIDAVKRHYSAHTGAARRFIDVPEWGEEGKPLRIFWTPLTLAEKSRIFPATRAMSETDWAELVVMKSQDEAGQQLFPDPMDSHILKSQADQNVVTRIGLAIGAALKVEEAIKNS